MAQPANTFDTYDAVGNREDLQDKVYMVSPEKTPDMTAARRPHATANTPAWQPATPATPH